MLALLSAAHRISGAFLSMVAIALPFFLLSVLAGPESYQPIADCLQHVCGQIGLALIAFVLNFHLLNGIRHLFWDAGKNLAVKSAERSAYVLFVVLILLTAAQWCIAHACLSA
ncbi:MAG: succinate dehydrogenase, cytochrome b556 subunit [Gammaproteobacteria bacterium]|nr:succinate dehydrogenase, cytochrome b556 subunit [Gammaproteobacteria bacterium]